jgi:predicted phage terminase large subunit-like protein
MNELKPQPGPQENFLKSTADIAVFGGSAGGGKSFGLLLECCYHIGNPGFRAVVFRRTVPMLRAPGGLWDASREIYPLVGGEAREQSHEWVFPSRAVVKFSGMELEADAYGWQGSEICLLAFDELAQFTEKQFFYLLSRNRSTCGVKPYVRASTNPDSDSWLRSFLAWWIDDKTGLPIKERSGVLRWFVRRDDVLVWADTRQELIDQFGDDAEPKSVTFIRSSVYDNRALIQKDPGYISNLKALPLVERERLLNGNWNVRAAAGNYFRREWFQIVDAPPVEVVARVRFWDRAASEQKPGTDPDATVGLLLSKDLSGTYFIENVVKLYATPGAVTKAMVSTASQDGPLTQVSFHQGPASAGVFEAEATAKALDGFNVRFCVASGDKETRAKPISAQCEAGRVKIVRGPWNESFLRELEAFPVGRHDDAIDALSGAHTALLAPTGGWSAETLKGTYIGGEHRIGRYPHFTPRFSNVQATQSETDANLERVMRARGLW